MGSEREFDEYMNELMALLQKIISNHPQIKNQQDTHSFKFPKGNSNVFIFNFFLRIVDGIISFKGKANQNLFVF